MTRRERMLKALRHEIPDEVPCAVDIAILIPLKMCAEETDLDVIEPLEVPPQGDCDLKEIKEKYGNKLVVKGNIHTSDIMLKNVDIVEAAGIKCIEDAAEGGGYILSTGDQCGSDTPYENILKLVEVCKKYGKY